MSKGDDSHGEAGARSAGRFRPDRQVIARRVDAGTVLIHLGTNRIYELNATGTRIWELLDAGCDAEGIRAQLQQEFDVEGQEAGRAIDETFALLFREGLIDSGSTH